MALVAGVALFYALTRLGEYKSTLEMARPLLETDQAAPAEFLLAAATSAASAPRIAGPDAERHNLLRRRIQGQLGEPAATRIAALAGSLPRAEVINRAWVALESYLNAPA